MNRQNLDAMEKKIEKKHKRREKRRKAKMKVSGAGVKRLQRIIIRKEKV